MLSKTNKKNQKDIVRKDVLQIFLLKQWCKVTEVIVKFNESIFWSWNIIILNLEKRVEKT